MFHFKLRAALVSLTAIATLALPASALATNVTTWQIVQQNYPGASNTDQAPYAGVRTELVAPPIRVIIPTVRSLTSAQELSRSSTARRRSGST